MFSSNLKPYSTCGDSCSCVVRFDLVQPFWIVRIIETNGHMPPLTYRTFVTIMEIVGDPDAPEEDPDYKNVSLPVVANFEEHYSLSSLKELGAFYHFSPAAV